MTVYNCESYVKYSVDSALSQTIQDFEIIVINDGSTDLSRKILDGFTDPRLTIVDCERMGQARALNLGLEKCAAPYVAILDADDVALVHRLDVQVSYLDAHADIVLAGSRYRPYIDKDGHSTGETIFPTAPSEIVQELREFKCPLFHSSIIFRKAQICDIGGYDESLACNFDWDLYVRVAARFQIANIDERLSLKRIHPKQFFGGDNGVQFSPAGLQSAMTVRHRAANLLKRP